MIKVVTCSMLSLALLLGSAPCSFALTNREIAERFCDAPAIVPDKRVACIDLYGQLGPDAVLKSAIILLAKQVADRHAGNAVPCRRPEIIDGDTVLCDGARVRLIQYDAFEICEEQGMAAALFLQALVQEYGLAIAPVGRDVYGRILAHGTAAGVDIGTVMRAMGYERPRSVRRPKCY